MSSIASDDLDATPARQNTTESLPDEPAPRGGNKVKAFFKGGLKAIGFVIGLAIGTIVVVPLLLLSVTLLVPVGIALLVAFLYTKILPKA